MPKELQQGEAVTGPTLQVLSSALPAHSVSILPSAILQEYRILMMFSDAEKAAMCVIANDVGQLWILYKI
jgi:hypothetical protein